MYNIIFTGLILVWHTNNYGSYWKNVELEDQLDLKHSLQRMMGVPPSYRQVGSATPIDRLPIIRAKTTWCKSIADSFSDQDAAYLIGPILILAGLVFRSDPTNVGTSTYPSYVRENIQYTVVLGAGLFHTFSSLSMHYISRSRIWQKKLCSIPTKMKIAGTGCVAIGVPLAISIFPWKYSQQLIEQLKDHSSPENVRHPIAVMECYGTNPRTIGLSGIALMGVGTVLWFAGNSIDCVKRLCKKSAIETDEQLQEQYPQHPPDIISQPVLLGTIGIGGSILARCLEAPTYRRECFTECFYGVGGYKGPSGYMNSSICSTAFMQAGAYLMLYNKVKQCIKYRPPSIKESLQTATTLPDTVNDIAMDYVAENKKIWLASKMRTVGILSISTGLPLVLSVIPWHYSHVLVDMINDTNSGYSYTHIPEIMRRGSNCRNASLLGAGLAALGITSWTLGTMLEKIAQFRA